MDRARRNATTIPALVAAALLLLAGCTMSTKGAAPKDSAIDVTATADPTTTAPDRDGSDAQMLRDTGSWAAGADLCRAVAQGPWRHVAYEQDPVGLVRSGDLPPGLDPGLEEKPDEVHEWSKAGDYEDPSTFEDPGAISQAMERAGFDEGAEAIWHNGHEEASINAVRYRDPKAAQAVLTAELTDYCTRAVSSRALPDGTGMDIVRDSGATRVLAVVDDTVISLWACSCISSRTDDGIGTWHDQFRAEIDAPAPNRSGA